LSLTESVSVAIFGLGEAGSLVAADLVKLGVAVHGFDPAALPTPSGVERFTDPAAAIASVNFVLAFTASADARQAFAQIADPITPEITYVDFSTSSVETKSALAESAALKGVPFVDVALLGIVPGNGFYTPSIASGPGARHFCEVFSRLGMNIDYISETPGEAAARKLLRSIFMKGVAGVAIEALSTAKHFELDGWLWDNMCTELASAEAAWLRRLILGTELHAKRRKAEMEAAAALIQSAEEVPMMTNGTVANLDRVLQLGLPFDKATIQGEDSE